MACDSIEGWLKAAFESAFPGHDFSGVRALPATDAKFGDFQCNDALAAAKTLHMPPRKIAEAVFARTCRRETSDSQRLFADAGHFCGRNA